MKDNQKQSKLNELIKKLSTDTLQNSDISAFIDIFREIYSGGFRHSYSSLTGIMLRVNKENEDAFDCILDNLSVIQESISESDDELGKALDKLYDHLSLESVRINQLNADYNQKIANLRDMIAHVEDEKKQLEDSFSLKISKLENEANKSKTEVVTILSIFAAIVLTFMGGMSFTSSTFKGIAAVSIYRLIGVEIICGLVIFNTIATLIYLVSKIVDKKISVKCKTDECDCTKKCWAVKKLRKKYPFIFWFNFIMITFMLIDVFAWCIDASEVVEYIRQAILAKIENGLVTQSSTVNSK